ncbi:DUF6783 domain-containing protein [Blautia acetigignens]|nr:DUF6783 domain-containing protein [Blautia acetigignens]
MQIAGMIFQTRSRPHK